MTWKGWGVSRADRMAVGNAFGNLETESFTAPSPRSGPGTPYYYTHLYLPIFTCQTPLNRFRPIPQLILALHFPLR
jgi:hypothetical protein